MKKIIFFLGLLISTWSYGFSEQDLISQLQKPQSVQGDFVQERHLKALNRPIITEGKFTLVANKGLLWQMEKPFPIQLRVTEKGIMQWNGKQWINNGKLGQAEQIRLFLGLLSGDVNGLKKQFKLALSGTTEQWKVTLTPDSLLMKQIFNQITIQGDEVVKRIQLDETQGDKTDITFKNNRLNQPLIDFVHQTLE
ncbi:outer membrane lipoprotein carrier protein LolA [Rodentibacter caecimuris]|uniref:LolA family protein n=1 Tax=Rodentibacter caecimuris TaxID=1796644 RepID=UPI001094BA67|nr:outer membrane lipoprotein carrier protein LolA [Pasteurella caecimuris]MCR1837157.1 outer membrane lipoprotein carrier protein LolA [Pasteurella caecimuris]MCU0106833.1 outer membrane lipoprotein carrier protein LolA [Pasteurella caecimuris]TGY50188.1 outer membrane lipoprotein carrier protein LolA [Pasteurella caecimuris]